MAEQEKFKPVGDYKPIGWGVRQRFVDDEGNVFIRGTHDPDLKGKFPTSRELDEKSIKIDPVSGQVVELQQKSEKSDLAEDPIMDPFRELNLSPSTIEKLSEMFDAKYREREAKLIAEFTESINKKQSNLPSSPMDQGTLIDSIAQAMAKKEMYAKGGRTYSDIKDLDPDDYDEVGATFTSYGGGYLIVDDVRNGHAVRTPYGRPLRFTFQGGRITEVGRVQEYSSFCAINIHSKKEIAWLRGHSRYGIEFYEDTKLAMSADAVKIGIASRVSKAMSGLDQHQLLARAKQYGIPLGGDLSDVRVQLILAIADEEMGKQEQEIKERNQGSIAEKFN